MTRAEAEEKLFLPAADEQENTSLKSNTMKVTTIRLPEDELEKLEREAEEYNFSSRTEYIRWILRNRKQIEEDTENTSDYTATSEREDLHQSLNELEDRLAEIENRVGELEGENPPPAQIGSESAERDSIPKRTQPLDEINSAAGSDGEDASLPSVKVEPITDDTRAEARGIIDELTLSKRSENTDRARKDALLWAWDYLRQEESAPSREIANAVWNEVKSDEVNYSNTESSRYPGYNLWNSCVRDELKKLPGVKPYEGSGSGEWEFVEGDQQ